MELATPITIYWDLPQGTADTASLVQACDDVIACRPLMLHLWDPGPAMGIGTMAVIEQLKGGEIAVSLTIPPAALDTATGERLPDFGLSEILLAVADLDSLAEGVKSLRCWKGRDGEGDGAKSGAVRPVAGISFTVTRENWHELPALVTCCREEGIVRLVLPMQRLYNGEVPFSLTRREQQVLADSLVVAGGVAGMALTIHDPFLWRAFNPGVPFPQGGCQAANTMLAIAPDGAVYPCPSLPVLLGELGQASLRKIVTSPAKKELRCRLAAVPADCGNCPVLAECRGGCRGRAYVVNGSLEGGDDACA